MNSRLINALAAASLALVLGVAVSAARPANAETRPDAPASAAVAGDSVVTSGKPADGLALSAADLAALPAVTVNPAGRGGAQDGVLDAPGVDGLNAYFGPYYNYIDTGCHSLHRYTWNLAAGTIIDVRVDGAPVLDPGDGGSGMDPVLSMYNAAGGLEAVDDDSGGNRGALMSRRILVGQTFSFVVRSYSNASSGPFRISFSTR